MPLEGESAIVDGHSYPLGEMVTCDSISVNLG
jgi:hypothetical protein